MQDFMLSYKQLACIKYPCYTTVSMLVYQAAIRLDALYCVIEKIL